MRFRPHQGFCMRCKKAGRKCDLNFKDMEIMNRPNPYSHMVTLVICKEFKQREQ